jgi:hypothetical protein
MMTRMDMRAGAAAVLLVLAAGCGGAADREDSALDLSADDGAAEDAQAPGDVVATDESGGAAAGAPNALAVDTAAIAAARDVVRTSEMQLTVDDAAAAADDVRRIATDAGGFVSDERERARDDEVDITVRVPAAGFDEVREDIGALGDVVTQNVDARDVTAAMVDVESRIGSLRASVERLRGLLSEAGDVGQLAMVEGELASRETELEAMLGQQRVLADQVALGTLSVALSEDEQPTVAEDTPGFTEGLRNGWVAALAAGTVALAAVGFALPFAAPVLLALLAVRVWQRRRRPPAPTPAESQP